MEEKKHGSVWEFMVVAIVLIFFLLGVKYACDKAFASLKVNPSSPVMFIKQEDINPQNMSDVIFWIENNFTALQSIIKIRKGDTLFVVGG